MVKSRRNNRSVIKNWDIDRLIVEDCWINDVSKGFQ